MHAFEEAGLRPAKITGASAGALVGGAWASGMSSHEVRDLLFRIRREDFWDPGFGAGFLRGQKFKRLVSENFVARFEDTRIPFEVSVFDILRARTEYLGRGDLPSAVVASCAVPGLFHPVRREGRLLWDGGVLDKPGINVAAAKAGGERVLSVFLETGSRTVSWYESRTGSDGPRVDEKGRVFRIGGMPSVGPGRLDMGPQAFDQCAAFVRAALAH